MKTNDKNFQESRRAAENERPGAVLEDVAEKLADKKVREDT